MSRVALIAFYAAYVVAGPVPALNACPPCELNYGGERDCYTPRPTPTPTRCARWRTPVKDEVADQANYYGFLMCLREQSGTQTVTPTPDRSVCRSPKAG